ncbi:hypothetical protein SmJEL517_g06133 [Synchytrium microbalum]|uniref:Zn(2)-C6 fungal-type domain-containing protein n=1 Tax=Synchytrium microbalum TaxID=1806994 RepID=A0A507BWR8_9FUNG|nr:uncharacterized protein SmJEL517_g06133 [Synchytrium microbalum]TPX30264.1 hypothetical protein SmJEL517_g06133 [Synchytrium microbalum]
MEDEVATLLANLSQLPPNGYLIPNPTPAPEQATRDDIAPLLSEAISELQASQQRRVRPPPQEGYTTKGTARKRQALACERCRIKKRKCDGVKPVCGNCTKARNKFDNICTYPEHPRRKGPRSGYRDALLQRLDEITGLLKTENGQNSASGENSQDENDMDEDSEQDRSMAGPSYTMHQQYETMPDMTYYEPYQILPPSTPSQLYPISPGSSGSSEEEVKQSESPPSQPPVSQHEPLVNQASYPNVVSPGTSAILHLESMLFEEQTSMVVRGSTPSDGPILEFPFGNLFSDFFVPGHQPFGNQPIITQIDLEPMSPLRMSMSPPPVSNDDDLKSHLIAVYFTFVATTTPVLHEPTFFANWKPVNRHPDYLLNAMYALAAKFSLHPELYKEPYGNPKKASQMFATLASDALQDAHSSESLPAAEACSLLASTSYGDGNGNDALAWIMTAVRMAQKMLVDRNDTDTITSATRLVGWQSLDLSPSEREIRRRIWAMLLRVDTYSTMGSGFPPLIYEGDYTYLLESGPRTASSMSVISSSQSATLAGFELWQKVVHEDPKHTIWDNVRGAPKATNPWVEYAPRREAAEMAHIQIAMILRRVYRHVFSEKRRGNFQNPGVLSVVSIFPAESDTRTIHDAMIELYASLPSDIKPFDSFADFCDGVPAAIAGNATAAASVAPGIILEFLWGVSTLHLDHVDHPERVFKTRLGERPLRVSSRDMVILAERAARFIVTSIYKSSGIAIPPFSTREPSTGGIDTSAPPASWCIVRSPMFSCCMFSIYGGVLSALAVPSHIVSSSILRPGDQLQKEETLRVLEACQRTAIPVMEATGRIWPISAMYSSRLRKIVEAVALKIIGIATQQPVDGVVRPPTVASTMEISQHDGGIVGQKNSICQ